MTVITRRSFLPVNSSAIANVDASNLPEVKIAYQSNPQKFYTFNASQEFGSSLVDVISADDLKGQSLGRMIADARSKGQLQEVTV
jgi:hypothetical protein